MINYYLYFFLIPITFVINYVLKKKKILLNYTGQKHQIYIDKNPIPLSGGIIIILFFILNLNYFGINIITLLFIFFIIGLLADLNLIKSPSYRFIIQILFLILFITNFNLTINDVRIDVLNIFLENYYFNIFFILFCLLVLINGSNFIDGNNCLAIGYYLIIFLVLTHLCFSNNISYESGLFISPAIILTILLIFNFANKLYLGDNGVYILSIYTGYILINLFNNNPQISPYFIVNLLWYPAFEILFSMIRKFNSKFSPMDPDTSHLHQLVYFYLNEKVKSKFFLNSLTGLYINLYNAFIIYLSSTNIYNTKIQILLLTTSVIIYFFCYIFFLNFKKLSFKK